MDTSPGKLNSSEAQKAPVKPSAIKPIFTVTGLCLVLLLAHRWWNNSRTWETTDNATVIGTAHQVSSRISGTVSEVLVLDHEAVHAGQILLKLDDHDEQAAMNRARAILSQADAQIALARAHSNKTKADYERATELIKSRVFSVADIDGARAAKDAAAAALAVAEAGKEVAEAALQSAALQLGYTILKAPSDGHVGAKAVQTGNRVFSGQPLMAVVEDSCWIVANFKETQISKMHQGQRVEAQIDAFPKHPVSARLESIAPASGATFALLPPDNATGNFTKIVQRVPVKVFFEEPVPPEIRGLLRPGLSAVVSVNVKETGRSAAAR
ncbi:MAG: multidrug efflux system [Verrucomicrobia bacterium]|nr:MAG: multidrug efflux system [Verrucomicrobiota bacterium]